MTGRMRVPRALHAGAWWAWATGLAVAASRTTNPLLLALVVAVTGYVVTARRPASPWSRSYVVFLRLGLLAIGIRVVLFALLGAGAGGHVLFRLPRMPLPHWMAGVRLGGPVSVDGVLGASYDGLRLAVILVCIGAANTLTSPRRLLKSLPAALYEVGVALTVALSFAPQAVAAVARLRAARRLRGRPERGLRSLRGLAVPVLEGALDRSVDLAAAMDARGFGRRGGTRARTRRATSALTASGLLAMLASSYGLLDSAAPEAVGLPLLVAGGVVAAAGFGLGARTGGRSRYRPDPWQLPEWVVAACGVGAAVAVAATSAAALAPPTSPPTVPSLPWVAAVGILLALVPAWAAPPVPRRQRPVPRGSTRVARTTVGATR